MLHSRVVREHRIWRGTLYCLGREQVAPTDRGPCTRAACAKDLVSKIFDTTSLTQLNDSVLLFAHVRCAWIHLPFTVVMTAAAARELRGGTVHWPAGEASCSSGSNPCPQDFGVNTALRVRVLTSEVLRTRFLSSS